MAAITSGLNFSTLSEEGISLATVSTFNANNPEYPAMPFAFGMQTIGLDGSEWIFAKPAAIYPIGTVGIFDTSWNFTSLNTTNGSTTLGYRVGVMSQVANVTAAVTTNYDGVWVQISGLCPAIFGAASSLSQAQLYTTATSGQLTSTSSSNLGVNGVIFTAAIGASSSANGAGILNYPEVVLTT